VLVRMTDAQLFRSGSDFCTVNSTPRALTSKLWLKLLDGDIGELHAVDGADIGDHHVELAAIGSDLGVKAVEVLELADVAEHAGDVQADRGNRLVQFVLTAGEDIDEGPFATNRCAAASPIPLVPPVITATLLCSLDIVWFLKLREPSVAQR